MLTKQFFYAFPQGFITNWTFDFRQTFKLLVPFQRLGRNELSVTGVAAVLLLVGMLEQMVGQVVLVVEGFGAHRTLVLGPFHLAHSFLAGIFIHRHFLKRLKKGIFKKKLSFKS